MNKLALGLMIVCLLLAVNGCRWHIPKYPPATSQTDSDTPVNWDTDFVQGQVYELQQPVFIVPSDIIKGVRWQVYPESPHIKSNRPYAPDTVEQYQREGASRWPKVKAVLEPGTRFVYVDIRMAGNNVAGYCGYALMRVLGDKYDQLGLISTRQTCKYIGWSGVPQINSYYLEEAEE